MKNRKRNLSGQGWALRVQRKNAKTPLEKMVYKLTKRRYKKLEKATRKRRK